MPINESCTGADCTAIIGQTNEGQNGVWGYAKKGNGVYGQSESGSGVNAYSKFGVGVTAESNQNTALTCISRGNNVTTLFVNQWGTGNIIVGRDNRNAEVFRVLNNGDVQVRGITITSDKNAKENFSNVNTLQILDKLASMPIHSWNYKDDPSSERHIGPTAQDFHATFELNGHDDKHISSIDLQGVALVAIQGLNEKNEKLIDENAQLHEKLSNLEARLSTLESKG